MQVKLIAAALVATAPLLAQAQTAVTVYGIADAAVSAEDNGLTGRKTVINSGNQSTSRFGFRGTEDLGNGLKAIFNVEGGYNIDTGAGDSALFGRRAVVGLEGSFGTLTIGREYTPIAAVAQFADALGQGFYGTNLGAFGTNKLTRRISNSVNYRSPSMSGLRLTAAYSAGEKSSVPVGQGSGNLMGLGAEYVNGNVTVGGAMHTIARLGASDDREFTYGGALKAGAWEFRGNVMVANLSGPNNKFDQANIGGTYTVNAHKVFFNYQRNRQSGGLQGSGATLAYTYTMSKRTNLYASYALMNNNVKGNFGLTSAGSTLAAGGAGKDPSALTMGVRHLF
jgi:predicted porin